MSEVSRHLAALAALIGTFAFAGAGLAMGAPYVIAFDQKAAGKTVTINYANLPDEGALAIYAAGAGNKVKGAALGQVTLPAGDHHNIKVDLSKAPTKGEKLMAVVEQAGKSGGAEQKTVFGGPPVEQSFKIG
jgi:hypothetical protein